MTLNFKLSHYPPFSLLDISDKAQDKPSSSSPQRLQHSSCATSFAVLPDAYYQVSQGTTSAGLYA
jgi:hypothetical protein